jgi:hypothetical protein
MKWPRGSTVLPVAVLVLTALTTVPVSAQDADTQQRIQRGIALMKQACGIVSSRQQSDARVQVSVRTILRSLFGLKTGAAAGYYINGRNREQQTAALGQEDGIWLALEFDGAADDVVRAQIILGRSRLQGPVLHVLNGARP